VHKKYKTRREAWEAFDRAAREGEVRAIEVDPPPDDFGGPGPISAATSLSIVPGCHLQRDSHQNAQCHQNAPLASGCSTRHSATRLGPQSSQLGRMANSTTNDVTWQRRRNTGNGARNTSSPLSSKNVDLVTSIGVGPLRRTSPEHDGYSKDPLRTMLGYVDSSGSSSSSSSPSRPAGCIQGHEHVDLPSSSWQNNNGQNNERGAADLPGSPGPNGTAVRHGKGELRCEDISRSAGRTHKQPLDPFPAPDARTATWGGQKSRNRVFNFLSGLRRGRGQGDDNDRRRASLQSVDTFLDSSDVMQSVQSSHPQLQTRAESHSPPGASILPRPSSACSHISLTSSIETIKSTLSFEVHLTESEEPGNVTVANPTSPPTSPFLTSLSLAEDIVYHPSTPSQGDLNEGDGEGHGVPSERTSSSRSGNHGSPRGALSPMEHTHPQTAHPNPGDGSLLPLPQPLPPQAAVSAFQTPTHFRTQNIRGRSPADHAASSPREVWPTSPSHYSFNLSLSPVSGLGLLTNVASPCRQPLPLSPAAQIPTSPVNGSVGTNDAQSPIRNPKPPPNREQAQALAPHLSVATPEDMQSVGTRPTNRGTLSHLNVPLPPSPASFASNLSTRLQVQPGHRRTPRMALYPSLASEDPELLSPSGLNVVFGLPTPGLSPMQTPALIRSPSMDPRSPVPSQMRIPGDIMGLLRVFPHSGHDLANVSFLFLPGLSFSVVRRLQIIIRGWFPDFQCKR
jgi:hypothetical protein